MAEFWRCQVQWNLGGVTYGDGSTEEEANKNLDINILNDKVSNTGLNTIASRKCFILASDDPPTPTPTPPPTPPPPVGKVSANEVIGHGGWTGSIAVADGYVYLANNIGELRRGKISSNIGTEVIGSGGWTGSIAVADGYVYLASGDLRRGKISSNIGTEVIGSGGWTGSIAVADGYVYLTTPDGNLLRGHL